MFRSPLKNAALVIKSMAFGGFLIGSMTSQSASAAGAIVAAGGGSEGDMGDTTSWSYKLYKKLIENGDVNADGKIKVAILSTEVETSWLPSYFVSLGATEAVNVRVATRNDANNTAVVDTVKTADVIFLKGGDQGVYYDMWNETLLESNIRSVIDEKNGAIGGTSAGAMSLAQFAFAGGKDLISLDVLKDAQTPYLDDADGGSGIHSDFLGFIPNVTIDTHYTTRGRLGRTMGILARAIDDTNNTGLYAIGIEERTGLYIKNGVAEVIGVGSIDFIQQTSTTALRRDKGRPLYYTNVRIDRLTEGWKFNLSTKAVDTTTRPSGTLAVTYAGDSSANSGSLLIRGSDLADEEKYARTIDYDPYPYRTQAGTSSPFARNTMGINDAHYSDYRGAIHESLFRAMYDYPSYSGLLLAYEGQLSRTSSAPDQLQFARNTLQTGLEAATIVVDGKTVSYKGLSPYVSNSDTGSKTLKASALINLRVHVMAETSSRGGRYNTRTHAVSGGPTGMP